MSTVGRAFVLLVVGACLTGCSSSSRPKAIYLVQGQGELSPEDLKAHPEVVVANTFDEFRQRSGRKVALWIDKNAVRLVDIAWLRTSPQKWYPIALVGYCNSLYAFRETLPAFGLISGPYVDWTKHAIEPGFSAGILLVEREHRRGHWSRGYPGKPTVEAVLKITNALLEGKREELINPPAQPGPRP